MQRAKGRGQKVGSRGLLGEAHEPQEEDGEGTHPISPTLHTPYPTPLQPWLKRLRGSFWVGLGYMLSPLSWWNDMFFNLPIAYAFGYLVRFFVPQWFLPGTVVGYWFSNVIGILMMQFGARDIILQNKKHDLQKDMLIGLGTSTLYTLVVVALIYFHILETPQLLSVTSNYSRC